MTTTRINHTGHDHPNTTAARTACRKSMSGLADAIARIDAHANGPVQECSMCGNTSAEDVSGAYSVCCNKIVNLVPASKFWAGCSHA